MKYRELNANEIEAYNIGYKVGARQIVIADIEFESAEEKRIYRKGYNAGCQDRLRRNVSNVSNNTRTPENQKTIVSNVSNVSDVKSTIAIDIVNNIKNNSRINTSSLSTTHEAPTCEQVLEYAKQQDDMAGVGGFAVSQEQAQDFYDYYSGIGWVVPNDAKTPIVDWKPFLRKWVRNPRFKTKDPDKIDINDPEHFII